jgi:fibronectin-binding autotransporter adhesin
MFQKLGAPRLMAAAAIALSAISGTAQAQLTATDFTPYIPANAASIQPGLFALYSIPVDSLAPTQINVGDAEVDTKAAAFNLLDVGGMNSAASQAALQADLLGTIEPVVIGPNGQLYQTDGHHSFDALVQSVFGASNPTVEVQVIANYSSLTPAQFIQAMSQNTQFYPFDNGVQKPVTQVGGNLLSPLPTNLAGLTQDAYRGLEYQVLKNNGAGGVGHDKTSGYSDFMWADLYRTAPGLAGGSGLAYLTPADASKAAVFSMNGANTGTLPGLGTVSVNQMPGYILPTGGSINITGQITNGNLGTGAIGGATTGTVTQGTMNGINGYAIGSLVIEPQVTGLLVQLGANNGGTVTLSNANNTYSGGTTITAGTLIIAGDGSLGTASTGPLGVSNGMVNGCSGANYSGCVDNAVRATNGIVFESLTEGNATLQFGTNTTGGTAMSSNRNISIGQEIANINMNGNTVTLSGNIATSNLNTSGAAPLVVDGKGTLILSGNNSAFHGDIDVAKGTLQVGAGLTNTQVDNALGATTGPLASQVEMDNGTFQAGGSFTTQHGMFMHGSVSTYDTNGFNTSWAGGLTDVQRTLDVINSGTGKGNVTFSSLSIGATAALAPNAGTSAGVSVTLTNGVTREGNATLFLAPHSGSLGTTEQVFDTGASATVKNGMVTPWIIEDTGGSASSSPYKFLTYSNSQGYIAATAGSTSLTTSTASQLVIQSGNVSLTSGGNAYALQLQASGAVTVGSGQTLTIGDGGDPAGLILNSKASINGGTLAFGNSEVLIYVKGSTTNANTIGSTITGSGGITLSGSGQLNLNTASQNTGAVVINSGQLVLNAANAIAAANGVQLENTNSTAEPGNAILTLGTSNTVSSINDQGTNSQIFLGGQGVTTNGNGIVLTIGQTTGPNANQSSSINSIVSDSSATSGTAGAITKNGSGLVDFSPGGTGSVTLNTASTILVNGGQLRLATDTLTNNNAIATQSGTEVQLVEGGTNPFGSAVTGGGALHLMQGNAQLTGTGNNYSGGTIMEIGTSLVATTATLTQAANQTIVNAGGTLVLDQTTSGNFTAIMSDGVPGTDGQTGAGSVSGSFVKADSTGGNAGNVTIANAQSYTGATTVEAGTLTLGAVNSVATSSGVALGTVGGGATATLALGAANTVQGLNSVAGNTTGVQLNGHALTMQQTAGAVSTFTGNISDTGSGSVNTTGGGTLALSGTNVIGGGMMIGANTTVSQTGGSLSVAAGNTSNTTTVTNNGTLALSGTSATYGGTFVNNGTITSDPSTQTFYNLNVSTTGSIQASAGDVYKVGGSFLNTSTQSASWNTTQAALEFYGSSGTGHTLDLVTTNGSASLPIGRASFNWGTLTIDGGNTLILASAFGSAGYALYVDNVFGADISGDDVTNIIGDGFNIYYDPYDSANAYLDGGTYDLVDGGVLTADVPEPSSLLVLLVGLGGGALIRRRRAKRRSMIVSQ